LSDAIVSVKAVLEKENWLKYGSILLDLKDQEREIKTLLHTIKDYWEKYPDQDLITIDELKVWFQHRNPSVRDSEVYDFLLQEIAGLEMPNRELYNDVLLETVKEAYARRAGEAIIPFLNGDKRQDIMEVLEEVVDGYKKKVGLLCGEEEADPRMCPLDIDYLFKEDEKKGLKWSLGLLNSVIGPLPPGRLGHIFACSNVGKSSLAISQGACFATQLIDDEIILHLGNEEAKKIVQQRYMCSLLNKPYDVLKLDPEQSMEEYLEKGGNRIKIFDEILTLTDVEHYLNRYKDRARVLFLDQGPKLHIRGDHARHEKLQIIYNNLREFGKKYNCDILSLGQGDANAEGKKFLSRHNIEGSKAGYLQGECDFIIGVGMTEDERTEDVRYISIPKNKLNQGREGRGAAMIDRLTGRYKSI
jgi:hypothetical protein